MATGGEEYPGPVHHATTQRSRYPYFFHSKHHRTVPSDDAQWLLEPVLTNDQEFAVFDLADLIILADDHGNLYGMRPKQADAVPVLGTRGEQVAIFPVTRALAPGMATRSGLSKLLATATGCVLFRTLSWTGCSNVDF